MSLKTTIKLGLATLVVPLTLTAYTSTTLVPILDAEGYAAYASTPAGSLPKAARAVLGPEHGMYTTNEHNVSVAGVLSADFLDSNVTGAGDMDYASVQGVTTVVDIDILNGLIKADALSAISNSILDGPTAESQAAGTSFDGLVVAGVPMASVAPNTTVPLPGVGDVTLNEQITGGDGVNSSSLTVNLIHVRLKNALGQQTGEIIIGSARSSVAR